MRKRIICALLALSCITMMISGCTPDATVQTTQNAFETQEDGITIQMLHIWPEHEDAMEKLVEAIEEKNTGLSVQISVTDSLPILWTITKRNVLWQQPTSGLMPTKKRKKTNCSI